MAKVLRGLSHADVQGMNLGKCCICETEENVTQIRCLDGRSPILGRGWGCALCNLGPHGACAVLCAPCAGRYDAGAAKLRWICTGHPQHDGRTPAFMMEGAYQHNMAQHVAADGGFTNGG